MEKSAPGQSSNKLYSFAAKVTDQSHKKLYRSIILILAILEFLTFGFKATHEEKIIYEKYHYGLEVDTPVQFHAVSTEVPLYTQTEVQHTMKIRKVGSTTYNVTTYYAYLIVTDENGNQAVVVLSEAFNDLYDTRPFLTPQARQDEAISDLSAEAGDLRDEINGKDGKTFYGVISSNELNQQQVITSNDKKLQKILSLDTLSIYHDEVPETVTVENGSNVFLRILILIALAAVVVFYLVMRAIIEREQEKVREREWKERIQRLTQKNPPAEEKEHEQQETSRKQTNEDEVVLQLIEVLNLIKVEKSKPTPVDSSTQDDTQTPPEHSEWAAWAKDKSNHEKLQELCGVKLVHTETQGMLNEFTAYSYTLGPKGWDDIKRIMVTIAASDQKAGAEATLESGGMGSETATETIELSAGNKVSEMDIKLKENSWMRLTMGAGSKNLSWIFRLRIYNQTGNAVLQILFAPEETGEVTLYLCGVLAATFGIAGKAPSGDVEQGIHAVIEYIDAQKDNSQERKAAEDTK